MMHGNGFGLPVDAGKAVAYLERAVEAGDIGAKMDLVVNLHYGSRLLTQDRDFDADGDGIMEILRRFDSRGEQIP